MSDDRSQKLIQAWQTANAVNDDVPIASDHILVYQQISNNTMHYSLLAPILSFPLNDLYGTNIYLTYIDREWGKER